MGHAVKRLKKVILRCCSGSMLMAVLGMTGYVTGQLKGVICRCFSGLGSRGPMGVCELHECCGFQMPLCCCEVDAAARAGLRCHLGGGSCRWPF